MSLAALLSVPCTITHRVSGSGGEKDSYGNPISGSRTIESVCELQRRQQRPGAEDTAMGDLAMDDWLLVLPAGTAVSAQDTVTIDGAVYEASGEPWEVRNPRTKRVSHIEAVLRRTTAPDDVPDS